MDWIEKQAIAFRNIPLINRKYKAVIHLENKEDESFWSKQLQSCLPATYLFVHYSKNALGNETRGCEQCLRYRPYLNHRFFICIDSDLRLLKGEEKLTAQEFIAQTYAYSWENHLCEATQLQERAKQQLSQLNFDFPHFIQRLSNILYRPLCFLVAYTSKPYLNKKWNISRFNACIPLQPTSAILNDQGEAYLTDVERRFETALSTLNQALCKPLQNITKENAYLHIQGHHIYKLILHIGSLLTKGTNTSFKKNILDSAHHTAGYKEIDSLQSDLNYLLHEVPLQT